MGTELVVMFFAALLFFCGLVLIFVSKGGWRKAGLFFLLLGIIVFVVCLIFWPRAWEHTRVLLGY